MTEKDRQLVETLLEKSIEQQSKLFTQEFKGMNQILNSMHELFSEKLYTIDRKVTITNGTVAAQAMQIEKLKEESLKHVSLCPNTAKIDRQIEKITTLEKMEVGRAAVSKFTWKQLTGIGIIAGVVFGVIKFIIDLIKI